MAKLKLANASFKGPQPGVVVVADRLYSYSGSVSVTSSSTNMNTFETGNYVTVLNIELHGNYNAMGTDVGELQVLMNGSEIVNTQFARIDAMLMIEPITLIVPPLTTLTVNMNTGSGSGTDWQTTITGRIYE